MDIPNNDGEAQEEKIIASDKEAKMKERKEGDVEMERLKHAEARLEDEMWNTEIMSEEATKPEEERILKEEREKEANNKERKTEESPMKKMVETEEKVKFKSV